MTHEPKAMAARGMALLKDAIVDELRQNPEGLRNADLVQRLGLSSHDPKGGNKDYLTYSLLGLLISEGRVCRREGKHPLYLAM